MPAPFNCVLRAVRCSTTDCWKLFASCACACSRVAPGRNRPIIRNHQRHRHTSANFRGSALSGGSHAIGIVTSCVEPTSPVPSKPGGVTPITVKATIVQIDLFADDCRLAAEAFLPIPITQHRDRIRRSLVIVIRQQTPERRCTPSPT